MKKFLALILTLLMALSSVSMAAPVSVIAAERAEETVDSFADVQQEAVLNSDEAAEYSQYGYLAYEIDFSDVAAGTHEMKMDAKETLNGKLPASVRVYGDAAADATNANGAYVVSGQYPHLSFRVTDDSVSFPAGKYTFQYSARTDGEYSTVRNVVAVRDSVSFATNGAAAEGSYLTNSFTSVTLSFYYDGTTVYGTRELTPGNNGLRHLSLYPVEKDAAYKGSRYYDDVKIWYMPEPETEHEEYGSLAYYLDFDVAANKREGSVSTLSVMQAASDKLSGIFPSTTKITSSGGAIKGTDGNGSFVVVGDYPTISFRGYSDAAATNAVSFPKGTYTFEWAAKADGTKSDVRNVITVYHQQDTISGPAGEMEYMTGEFKTYSTSFTFNGKSVVSDKGKVLNVTDGGMKHFGIYSPSTDAKYTGERYYDYVKIWYKPLPEIETEHENYGHLAYYVDFDIPTEKRLTGVYTDFTSQVVSSQAVSAMMPEVMKIEHSDNTANAGTDVYGHYIVDNTYGRILFSPYDSTQTTRTSFPKGKYTVQYSAKTDGTCDTVRNVVLAFQNSGDFKKAGEMSLMTSVFNEYTTSFYYDGKNIVLNDGTIAAADYSDGFSRIALYPVDQNNAFKGKRYYDYVKIWYSPETEAKVNVTFDLNGKDVSDFPQSAVLPCGINSLSAYKPSDVGTARFVGWSLTKDGKIVSDSIALVEDITLYAVWDEYYYAPQNEAGDYLLAFNAHFNNVTAAKPHNGEITSYGTYGKAVISDIVKGTGDVKILLGCDSDDMMKSTWSNAANTVISADDEIFIVSGLGAEIEKIWPRLCVAAPSGAYFADGYYKFTAEVYIMPDDNVSSLKYTGFALGKQDGTDGTRAVGEVEIPSDGSKSYITTEFIVYNGSVYNAQTFKRVGDVFDVNSISSLGFIFTVERKQGTTQSANIRIFGDNFRLYYKPVHQPTSLNEKSIRVNEPSGLRFKSSVSTLIRNDENVSEYGYIVTRQLILKDLGVETNDFTMENALMTKDKYVMGVSYGMADGSFVDRVYADDGINTFFTAVVYNIPSNMYEDVIVVRPYVKVGDKVTYGAPMSASIYEVAQTLRNSSSYEANKDAIDKILNYEEF